jgi:hypothetical protein
METNIIKDLVKSDRDVRQKLEQLQSQYDKFLQKLSQFRIEEEKRLLSIFDQEAENLNKQYQEKLTQLEIQLKMRSKEQASLSKIKNIDQEADALFHENINGK